VVATTRRRVATTQRSSCTAPSCAPSSHLSGQGAFEKFYADGVENFDAPCVGKDFGTVEQVKSAELLAQSYDDKTGAGFSEWDWDVVFKGGFNVRMRQVGVRRWKDGQVVHERFYYKPAM
jgi:hypothetical protein